MGPHHAGDLLGLCTFLVVAAASRTAIACPPWAADAPNLDAHELQADGPPGAAYSTDDPAFPDAAAARGRHPAAQEPARAPAPTPASAVAAPPVPVVEPMAVATPMPTPMPRQRWRRSDRVRDYWRDPDQQSGFIGGNYSRALGEFELPDGTPMRERSAFDVALGGLIRPRVYLQLKYHREVWEASPVALWSIGRVELMYGLDLLALPPSWRVRPALMAMVGFGFGRINLISGPIDPQAPSGQMPVGEKRGLGIGGVFAGEFAIHLRVTEGFDIAPYGGVMIPAYIYNRGLLGPEQHIDGEHAFGRAWRWLVGIKLGWTSDRRRRGNWLVRP